ncbi:MAG: LCP family protein [Firmicutes bacterium]|nr:LCP family protein [Bacillota bacterium]
MKRIGAWMVLTFLTTAFSVYGFWQLADDWHETRTGEGPAPVGRVQVQTGVSVPKTSRNAGVATRDTTPQQEDALSAVLRQSPAPNTETQMHSVNWLIVGSDSRKGEAARSDALLLARVQPHTAKVYLLSIPRDMRVPVQGYGYTKINHAYAYGGMPLLKDTVQKALDLHIDHTVAVNFHGFIALVDAVGGVTVRIDHPLHYDDATDHTHIRLEPGWQHLSGQQALDYVRFRHDAMADTGRMARQQQLLSAGSRQHVPVHRWRDVIAAAFALPKDVRTDAGVWEVFTTVTHLTRAKQIAVTTHTLKGVNRVDPQDGMWYFYVDPHERQALQGEWALWSHGH